ncbi:MAG: Sec-independent protein translocase protein TatB [Pseudomonadota bacterium]
MPDIGMMELLVIGIVALIVVGPKDLPKMFRSVGQFTGRVRGMAREFNRAMNDAASDSGMSDITKDLRQMSNPKKMGLDAVNKAFEGIDPTKYPEGSESRKLAAERAADSKKAKERAEEVRAARGSDTPVTEDDQVSKGPAPQAQPEPSRDGAPNT